MWDAFDQNDSVIILFTMQRNIEGKIETSDKESIDGTNKKLLFWLGTVDGSELPEIHDMDLPAWDPRLIWLLLIYEIATTTIDAMEGKVSGYLCEGWLGDPPAFTSFGLHRTMHTSILCCVRFQRSLMT